MIPGSKSKIEKKIDTNPYKTFIIVKNLHVDTALVSKTYKNW